MAYGGKITYDIGFNIDKNGLAGLKTQLDKLRESIPSGAQLFKIDPSLGKSGAMKQMHDIRKSIDEVEKAFRGAFNVDTGLMNLQKLNTSLNTINVGRLAKNFSYMGKEGKQAFYEVTKSALTTEMQFKKTNGVLDRMGKTFANTIKWQISSSIIHKFTGSIQEAYGYVKHLDSSLNDIRIVTGKSADEMDRFAKSANKAAKSLGAATTDYTEAALIYYQQGLGDEESKARTETTLKTANVTGQSAKEVSEELTAVWNGYRITAEGTEAAVDKLAAVAATTASNLQELSTGMSKVASAANSMGVDIDQLNAQISTIISVTRQAPESVGTALKTIYARIGDLKLGDADEDGLKLGDVAEGLDKLGINVLDAQGDLRDLGKVIEEVAGKWSTWTSAQQAAVAELMAGKRQYNNLIALFDNWGMYESALATSKNAVGTLQKQQDVYMESTEAHLQQLSTQWEDFYDSILDTDTINSLVDALTKVVNLFTQFIDSIGGGKNLFVMLGSTAIRVFDKQIAGGIINFINNIKRGKDNVAQLNAQLNNIALFDKFRGLNAASASLIDALKTISQYYTYMNNEQINEANNIAKQIGDTEILKEEWVETTQALKDYGNATQELIRNHNYGVDGKGVNLIGDVSDYDLARWEDLSNQATSMQQALKLSNDEINAMAKTTKSVTNEFDGLSRIIKKIDTGTERITPLSQIFSKKELKNATAYIKNIKDYSTVLQERFDRLNKTNLLKHLSPEQLSNINKAFKDMQDLSIDSTYEEISAAIRNLNTNLTDVPKEARAVLESLQKTFDEGREKFDEYNERIERLKAQMRELGKASKLEKFATSITGIVGSLGQIASSISALKNLGNVWTDENLSGSEKMLQTITNIGFSLPMLVSAYGRYKDSLYNIIQSIREKNGLSRLEIELQDQLIAGRLEENSLKEVWNGLSKREQANYLKRQSLQKMDITLLNEQQKEELALMGVRKASTKILGGITAGLAIVTAGYSIISSVVSSYNKRKEEEKQAYIENKKVLAEEAQSRVDERNKILEVKDSLTDLIDEYKKANISREDFIIQSYKTIDGLDGEAIAALNTAKSWQEASKAIDEYYARVSESNVEDLTKKNEELLLAVAKNYSFIGYKDGELYVKDTWMTEDNDIKDKILSYLPSKDEDYKEAKETQLQIQQEQTSAAGYRSGLSYAQTEAEFETGSELYKNYLEKLGFSTQEIQTAYLDYLKKSIPNNKYANQVLKTQSKADIITGSYFGDLFTGDVYSTDLYNKAVEFVKEAEAQGLEDGIAYVDWKEILSGSNYREGFGEEAFEAVKEELKKHKDELREGFLNIVPEISTTLSKALSEGLEGSLDLSSEDYEGFIDNIQKLSKFGGYDLTDEIEIFTNEGLIGTEKWTQAVYALQEALNDLELEKMTDDFSSSLSSIDFAIDDVSTLKNQLKELTDQDYSISVKVHSNAEEAFNNTSNALNNIDEMASKIGESFIVAADDLRELNNTFPGILEGMEYLADGTVQLNEEVVKSAMEAASQEEKADTEATITKLQNSATELRAKAAIYDEMAQLAYEAAEGKVDAEEAATKISVKLEKIEAENDKIATDTEIDNAHLVVDDSASSAPKLAENWTESYQEAASAANNWAEVAVAAHEAALTGDRSKKKDFGVTYQGKYSGASETRKAHNAEFGDVDRDSGSWKEVGRYYEDQAESLRKQANDIEGMAFELGAKAIKSISGNAGVGLTDKDSSSSGSEKEAQHEEYLERETDLYAEINQELDDIENHLKRIQETESHSWGQSQLDAIQEENKLLDEQLDKLREKKKIQEGDLSVRRKQLEDLGATFSEDGAILYGGEDLINSLYANYNGMVDTFNAMSADEQEAYKVTLEAEKDRIDKIEKATDDYIKLYSDYQSVIDEIQKAYYDKIAKDVEEFNFRINLKLELDDVKREWSDFWHDIINDLDSDDFAGQINKLLDNVSPLLGGNGEISDLTNHINEVVSAVATQISSHGLSGMFGVDTALSKEQLEEYMNTLKTKLQDVKEALDGVAENYLKQLDKANELIEEQVKGWESVGDHIEHNIELIKMISGDDAYDELGKQFDQQYENDLKLLQTQKMSKDYWAEQIKKYQDLLEITEEGSKEWKTYSEALTKSTEEYRQATADLDSTLKETLEDIKSWYENSINKVTDALDKSLSGNLGLDLMEKEWKLIDDAASDYYDNVERWYNMEDYTKQLNDAANAIGLSAQNQAKLVEFRDKELEQLNAKEKLTQYDIEESKARLEILKAQLALEDLQQNKSKMRLRRDNQGNYTYQYTGDEAAIDQAENGLLTARRNWYEIVKKRYQETSNKIIEISKQQVELQKQIADAKAAGDTERENKLMEMYKRNQDRITFWYEQAGENQKDLKEGVAQYFAEVDNAEILPQSEATVRTLIDQWAGSGEDSFTGAVSKAIDDTAVAVEEFNRRNHEALVTAGVDYQNLVQNGIDPATDALNDLVDSNDELGEKLEENNELLREQEEILRDLEDAYNQLESTASEALQSSIDMLEQLSKASMDAISDINAAVAAADNASGIYGNVPNATGGTTSRDDEEGTPTPDNPVKKKSVFQGYSSAIPGSAGSEYSVEVQAGNGMIVSTSTGSNKPIIQSQLNKFMSNLPEGLKVGHFRQLPSGNWMVLDQIGADILKNNLKNGKFRLINIGQKNYPIGSSTTVNFKSGGYTGDWSGSGLDGIGGRMAVLHQKELVLNESDTANMLKAVSLLREIPIDSFVNSILGVTASISGLLSRVGTDLQQQASSVSAQTENNYRNMTVNADFSGVRSAEAIYQALTELENQYSQTAYSTSPIANRRY